ncbi:MAG: TonB-dependent receptor domain-containing protein, partial [Bryobacteraceae bacterium]
MSRAFDCLLLLAACAALAPAQGPLATAAIQGTILDSSGAVVAGARISVTHTGMGFMRAVESDEAGQFRLTGLPAGEYRLRIEKEGFASVLIPVLPLAVGQTLVQRIELKPAPVRQSLEVKERPEALETAATTAGVALGSERIEEAPAANRNYLNFVLVAPAVAPSSGSNAQRSLAGLRSAVSDSGFSFAGMRGRNNSLSIDGVDNRDETTGGNRVAIGLEMVSEFRVSTAVVGAELGGAAGGVLNVVTRSGTNIWHGDVTFFGQNEALNARNPEAETGRRPRFRRYQPGTSLMGPLRRDRTFFAWAIEHQKESGEEWSSAPDGVPASALAAPLYRGLYPAGAVETEFSFKTDHQASTRHSLSARYAFSRGRIRGDVQDADNFTERSARGSSLTVDHSLVGGWIWVPGPRVVSDLRVQVARRSVELRPNARGPMIEIPGVLTFGQSFRLDSDRDEDHFELREALHVAVGRNQLSLGASVHAVRLDARLANRFGGAFIFPSWDDWLAARPDVYFQAFGEPKTHSWTLPVGAWIQERQQLAPGLTLEAGLRYDRQWLPGNFPESDRNLAPRLGLAWRPRDRGPYV